MISALAAFRLKRYLPPPLSMTNFTAIRILLRTVVKRPDGISQEPVDGYMTPHGHLDPFLPRRTGGTSDALITR
jgi:hypothetical protein